MIIDGKEYTPEDWFIHEAQAYYGMYNKTQKKYVKQWLSKRSEKAIRFLWAECLKTVEAKYKQPPCVADLEKAWKEVREHKVELMPQHRPLLEEGTMPKEEVEKLLRETLGKLAKKALTKKGN